MKPGRVRVLFMAAALLAAACGGGDGGGSGDGGTGGPDARTDGATGMDGGTGVDTGFPVTDGGPIVVRDGGVTITEDGGATFTCYPIVCDGHLLECGDCLDNDGDGRVDWRDPECLGPCDNTEGPALAAGVGGETGGPCKADCYFDFGNGAGNDDCNWDHRCDPLSVAPNYPPEGPDCPLEPSRVGGRDCPAEQSETCLEVCRPLTPNGCDCFGCCTFPALAGAGAGGSDAYVWIGALGADNEGTCTFDKVNDPTACPPCTPVEGCWNECGRCELCVGRDTLPDDCYPPPPPPDGGMPDSSIPWDGGVPERCDPGVQPCGLPGDEPCAPDYYCVTGCCIPTII